MTDTVLSILHGINLFCLRNNKGDYYHNFLNEEMKTRRTLIISSRVTKIVIGRVSI